MRNIPIKAFAIATHSVIWFIVAATVLAEVVSVFKNLLATTFGHHWVAKSDIAVILFVVVLFLLSRSEGSEDVSGLIKGVLASALTGAVIIFAFYLAHYLGAV